LTAQVPDLAGLSREELIAHAVEQEAQIAELTAAHERLQTAYDELAAKVAKLEHLLSRKQKGAPGANLSWSDVPDERRE
jgi:hypothetical protein